MECFKYEIKPNPKILKELQDRKMFNSDLHLKHVDFMHTAVIDSFPPNLKCNSNLLNIIKYCIQGYFRTVLFSPFYICKWYHPVSNSPRHTCVLNR